MNSDINILHSGLLKMMKELHKFCINNNIKYYLVDGSALGAIRHKGFIPWDDDIDVGMYRADYEKFLRLKEEFLYEIKEYRSDKKFKYGFIKIYDNNTTLVERVGKNVILGGIFIDVFPIDYVGNNLLIAQKKMKKIQLYKRILSANVARSSNKSIAYNIVAKLLSIIPTKYLINHIYSIFKKESETKSDYLCSIFSGWGVKEIMHESVIGTPTIYKFEDTEFFSIENYDIYLKSLYDNYLKLPPENKRDQHNFIFIDTKKSYKDYKRENFIRKKE